MGEIKKWWSDCPHCGGKDTLEHFESLSSLIKTDTCEDCEHYVHYIIDEDENVVVKMEEK